MTRHDSRGPRSGASPSTQELRIAELKRELHMERKISQLTQTSRENSIQILHFKDRTVIERDAKIHAQMEELAELKLAFALQKEVMALREEKCSNPMGASVQIQLATEGERHEEVQWLNNELAKAKKYLGILRGRLSETRADCKKQKKEIINLKEQLKESKYEAKVFRDCLDALSINDAQTFDGKVGEVTATTPIGTVEIERDLERSTARGEQGYDNDDDLYCHATTCGCDQCANNESVEGEAVVEPPRRPRIPEHATSRSWAAIADAVRRHDTIRMARNSSRWPYDEGTRRRHELQLMSLVNASCHPLTQESAISNHLFGEDGGFQNGVEDGQGFHSGGRDVLGEHREGDDRRPHSLVLSGPLRWSRMPPIAKRPVLPRLSAPSKEARDKSEEQAARTGEHFDSVLSSELEKLYGNPCQW